MTPLIDATEMYLRTVWELEEEGILPIRARLVERLGLSAPAVSETVARLEAEGLVHVEADRRLALTERGRELAVSVMRKHRLAETLLTDVIGLDWEQVHNEACRWEHVISDAAEARIAAVLGNPEECPYGNPIPGGASPDPSGLIPLSQAAKVPGEVVLRRISEHLQVDEDALRRLREHGLRPGSRVAVGPAPGGVRISADGAAVTLASEAADLIYVGPVR